MAILGIALGLGGFYAYNYVKQAESAAPLAKKPPAPKFKLSDQLLQRYIEAAESVGLKRTMVLSDAGRSAMDPNMNRKMQRDGFSATENALQDEEALLAAEKDVLISEGWVAQDFYDLRAVIDIDLRRLISGLEPIYPLIEKYQDQLRKAHNPQFRHNINPFDG